MLEGWELSFDLLGFPPSEPGFATLRRSPGACVHGLLVALDEDDVDTLLRSEFADAGETRSVGYHVVPVTPTTYDGRAIEAFTLVAPERVLHPGTVASRRYMKLLRTGAQESGLNPEWVAFLTAHPAWQTGPLARGIGQLWMLLWAPLLLPTVALAKVARRHGPGCWVLWAQAAALVWLLRGAPRGMRGELVLEDGQDWAALAAAWPRFRTRADAIGD